MKRAAVLVYGAICYILFLGTLLYSVGFVGNLWVPKSIDSGPAGDAVQAVFVDVVLLGLFAVPHSVMARPWFKQRWTKCIPPVVERSTYVLVSTLSLALLYWLWQPLPSVVWDVGSILGRAVLYGVFFAGWAIVVLSTFMTDHFDLFGLRQVYCYGRGQPYAPPAFRMSLGYKYVRHPIMLGFLIAFWATPTMTAGHLLFAVTTTVYVLVAIPLEERDLVRAHGAAYEEYRRRVGMLLPLPWRKPPLGAVRGRTGAVNVEASERGVT